MSRYFWNLQTCLKHWYFKLNGDVTGMACGLLGICGRFEGNIGSCLDLKNAIVEGT